MRARLSVRCVALTAACLLSVSAALASEPPADIRDAILGSMQLVLAGELPAAQAAVESTRAQREHALLTQLATELGDLGRGGYATADNRSFETLAPFWLAARQQWLETRAPEDAATLPAEVLQLAPTTQRLLVIDASRSAAMLFARGVDGWTLADRFYVSTGVAGFDKRRRGDRRTPLGVYWSLPALDTSALPARYGSAVYPLDYPNALDRWQGRTGDGIWLHGIHADNNIRPPRDTDGCIALMNDRIGALKDILSPRATPIVVTDRLRPSADATLTAARAALQLALTHWRAAIEHADTEAYFALYADEYARFGLSPALWRDQRRRVLESGVIASLELHDIEIFAADADAGVFLTRFRLRQRVAGGETIETRRRLYWQRDGDDFRIVSEQSG